MLIPLIERARRQGIELTLKYGWETGLTGEWFIRIDNVFNTAYESHFGYPDDGIRFDTGIQMRF